MKAQRITDTISHHGEGPCWWPATGRLRFVDMLAGSVIELDEGGKRGYRRLPVPSPVASVIRPRAGGGAIVATERGLALGRAEDLSDLKEVVRLYDDLSIRTNEGGCDPDGRFWIVYACLMTVQFLAAMYHTVVATALPTIIGDLGGVAHMSWAVTAYTLGQTLAMPVYGKVGDALGRKPLYLLAIALFVGGSALCGTAAGMLGFTVFRFLQGLGGAGLMICSQAIAGDLIPPRVRGKYLAPMGAMFGIAAILGPLLGGWLTDWLGWRSIFWFFLPFGAFAWIAVALALTMPRRRVRLSIDWAGLTLAGVGATGIVLLATWGGTAYPWSHPLIVCLLVVTIGSWAALVPVERRVRDPLIPPRILADRTFVVATIVSVLMCACLFGMNGYLPTYLQMVHGVSATVSGLVLVPGAAAMFAGSLVSGWLVSRTGRYRIYPVVGSLLAAAVTTVAHSGT